MSIGSHGGLFAVSYRKELLDAIRKGDGAAILSLVASDPALLNARGDDGVPAVRLAMYYRHPEIAQTLIQRGATLEIHDAAAAGEMQRLRELATGDAALVNSLSTDGATPLGLAAFFGQREAVEFLLDHGAQIDMRATNPAFPFTPLHSAMSAGHKAIAGLLLAPAGHKAIAGLLLARGADVNVREGGGMTVLHEAAGQGNLEYLQMLLERGANPSAKTDDGKLPEDFARERKFAAVVELLERARAAR
ncbi:Ankyrin [Candidatus Sulfopaludibacter sp. SbA3]|nr:Ankyrin [Candidatus Sulfopaludibacter sp. SbA3]